MTVHIMLSRESLATFWEGAVGMDFGLLLLGGAGTFLGAPFDLLTLLVRLVVRVFTVTRAGLELAAIVIRILLRRVLGWALCRQGESCAA